MLTRYSRNFGDCFINQKTLWRDQASKLGTRQMPWCLCPLDSIGTLSIQTMINDEKHYWWTAFLLPIWLNITTHVVVITAHTEIYHKTVETVDQVTRGCNYSVQLTSLAGTMSFSFKFRIFDVKRNISIVRAIIDQTRPGLVFRVNLGLGTFKDLIKRCHPWEQSWTKLDLVML